MNHLPWYILPILCIVGCDTRDEMPRSSTNPKHSIQFFNEAVLGSKADHPVAVLLPAHEDAWAPKQVILDYKDSACYGAMVHYDKSRTFEQLRAGINERFARYENETFKNDPEMGIWRNEEAKFAIQLTEDEDSYMAIYLQFVDTDTVIEKLQDVLEDDPSLLEGLDLSELENESESTEQTDEREPE